MSDIAPYLARWYPPGAAPAADAAPVRERYQVPMPGGATLELPIRELPDGKQAIALLMTNQTTFAVEAAMAEQLARLARPFAPEVIVGVPTLGLDYARATAHALGMQDYVALGFSRKFWYDEDLSESATSITSTTPKRLYLDPALRSRVAYRRVVLVDDVINTGGTAAAAIRLLTRVQADVVALVVGLTEGHAWREALGAIGADWPARVQAAGHIPMFRAVKGGWEPIPETLASAGRT